MNKIVKEQLKKVSTAKLPAFDDSTTSMLINKHQEIKIVENSYYLIEIKAGVLNPTANSILSSNWNEGSIPKHHHYKCEVIRVLGQMIKITGLAYDINTNTDLNEMWSGWIPLDGIDIIKKL
jgi:hypothetical protein